MLHVSTFLIFFAFTIKWQTWTSTATWRTTGEILRYFFIGFPIWMDGIDPQRLCSENSFWESFSTGSTQATAPAAHPELSKGQDHLLRKKPVQLKNCTWEWLQKRGNNKPSFSWMPGAHMPGSGYYIVRFRSYQRWQCDFYLHGRYHFRAPCIQKISKKTHIWKKALPKKNKTPFAKKKGARYLIYPPFSSPLKMGSQKWR